MRARGDFTDRDRSFSGRSPRDHVPTIGDVHLSLIRAPFNATGAVDSVQFRMERPTEDVESKFGDFWANREHR